MRKKSENAAHELDSTLRDAGIATKLSISDDLAHIGQLLTNGEADIVLLTDKLEGLKQILPRLRENAPHIPVILLSHPGQVEWTVAQALDLGATDVVPADQLDQLTLVVKRELAHICQREHFSQVRRALQEAEQRCQLLLQGSKAAIAYIHEGMHIHANEGYLDLFGYADVDDLCGESLVDLLVPESAELLKANLKSLRNGTEEAVFDFSSNGQHAEAINGSMTLANSQYQGEACLQVTVRTHKSNSNNSPADVADNPAESPSPADPVALELPGFIKAAETLFQNDDNEAFVLIASLDNYTELQSAYGLVGTETICRRVWHAVSEYAGNAPVTKISNHQFAWAITATSYDKACELAEQLRLCISELLFEVHDKTVRPTIAISGAALAEHEGVSKTLDAAFGHLAEMDLANTANAVNIPLAVQEQESVDNDDARVILRQITNAIDKKNFVLLFQPIISLRGDSDEHYEVFLRMTDESGNQIEPGRFLQTAIDNNVAGKIDRWVILQSIKMLSVHRAKGHATRLTINLTCNSVTDPEFLQWLGVAIKAARLPSDAVIFQITEKDATTYLRQTREFIEGLRQMHCRASLSRFGLIEDPFETLRHLQVDMVKLDGSCIAEMEDSEEKTDTLIASIKKLQGSGKLTVVPMVENANVLSTLWQAGANYIQGHYLQEPSQQMDYDFSTEE